MLMISDEGREEDVEPNCVFWRRIGDNSGAKSNKLGSRPRMGKLSSAQWTFLRHLSMHVKRGRISLATAGSRERWHREKSCKTGSRPWWGRFEDRRRPVAGPAACIAVTAAIEGITGGTQQLADSAHSTVQLGSDKTQ